MASKDSYKADDGNRTRLPSLGSWCSTDELHLRDTLYYNTRFRNCKGKNEKH